MLPPLINFLSGMLVSGAQTPKVLKATEIAKGEAAGLGKPEGVIKMMHIWNKPGVMEIPQANSGGC